MIIKQLFSKFNMITNFRHLNLFIQCKSTCFFCSNIDLTLKHVMVLNQLISNIELFSILYFPHAIILGLRVSKYMHSTPRIYHSKCIHKLLTIYNFFQWEIFDIKLATSGICFQEKTLSIFWATVLAIFHIYCFDTCTYQSTHNIWSCIFEFSSPSVL